MRTVAETEELGVETLGELGRNREKIESAREKVCRELQRDGVFLPFNISCCCIIYAYYRNGMLFLCLASE